MPAIASADTYAFTHLTDPVYGCAVTTTDGIVVTKPVLSARFSARID